MSKPTPKSDLELGESKQTNRDMKGNHQPAEFQVTVFSSWNRDVVIWNIDSNPKLYNIKRVINPYFTKEL